MKVVAGRVAVVTGAASGIGLALATRFAAAGMKLVLADVEAEALARAADEIRAGGAEAISVVTDVSKEADVQALATATLDHYGAVHVVCNNAGVTVGGLTWERSVADWEWVLGVNVWGVIYGVRTFLPLLFRQREAHMINTASIAGFVSGPGIAPYTVSKHAVIALSECVHHELQLTGNKHVKVSVLCPGWVSTRLADAERNRPPGLAERGTNGPHVAAMDKRIRAALEAGEAPADVAERVMVAIERGDFYIFTSDEAKPDIAKRATAIADGDAPTYRTSIKSFVKSDIFGDLRDKATR